MAAGPERIARLQDGLTRAGFEATLLGYSRSLFYYAGTTQPSLLVVTPKEHALVVAAGGDLAREESWVPPGRIASGGQESARSLLEAWGVRSGRLGLELDVLSAKAYLAFSELFSGLEPVDVTKLVLAQRARKDPEELAHMRGACASVHAGHLRVLEVLREGMTELELSAEVEDAQRRAGHEGIFFMRQLDFFMGRGPLASGENLTRIAGKVRSITGAGLSPSVPMGASTRRIERGDLIVVDIPTHCYGYHSDQSRTYSIGEPRGDGPDIYRRLKETADRLIEHVRPGVRCGELYDRAWTLAQDLGLGDRFMRLGNDPSPVPFIGHGLGLELNEPPLLAKGGREVLEEGMVVTLELETGGSPNEVTKLEDTLLVTSNGAEILTITPRLLHQV